MYHTPKDIFMNNDCDNFTLLFSIVSHNLKILQHTACPVMSNKNRIGYVAIALVAALLAEVATVPLKCAAAQNATSQNATATTSS
jgi:hypothetical protein